MIIKVQSPEGGCLENLLAYSEDLMYVVHIPQDSQAGRMFNELLCGRPKAYFEVRKTELHQNLELVREVKNQEW